MAVGEGVARLAEREDDRGANEEKEREGWRGAEEERDRGVVVPADDEVALLLSLNTTRGS